MGRRAVRPVLVIVSLLLLSAAGDSYTLGAGRFFVTTAELTAVVVPQPGPLIGADAPAPLPTTTLPPVTSTPTTTTPSEPAQPPPPPAVQPLRPPVGTGDFADPSVVWGGDQWYAFATDASGRTVPVMSSPDLAHWSDPAEAVPARPPWAFPGYDWAPTVAPIAFRWVMYVSMNGLGNHCVDRLVASAPGGPYAPVPGGPLVCSETGGIGAIDPFVMVMPDAPYLYWKADDASGDQIFGARLSPDGMSLASPPVALLGPTAPWQKGVTENPTMAFVGGTYWLVYSGASWSTDSYGMGVAHCDGPLGPCHDDSTAGPWIGSNGGTLGPGGGSLFTGPDGAWYLAYHAWNGTVGYRDGGARVLHVEPVTFTPFGPMLADAPPQLTLDPVVIGPDGVRLTGWARDPDTGGPAGFQVTLDGASLALSSAQGDRADLAAMHPPTGSSHGFDITIGPAPGDRQICVVVPDDVGMLPPTTQCTTITVPGRAFGSVDSPAGSTTIDGWVIDPSTTGAASADVYVDGTFATRVTADDPRPDVAAAWPAYGADHGFHAAIAVPTTPGPHTACVYGIADDDHPAPRLGCITL